MDIATSVFVQLQKKTGSCTRRAADRKAKPRLRDPRHLRMTLATEIARKTHFILKKKDAAAASATTNNAGTIPRAPPPAPEPLGCTSDVFGINFVLASSSAPSLYPIMNLLDQSLALSL